jgi:hypothetical protein
VAGESVLSNFKSLRMRPNGLFTFFFFFFINLHFPGVCRLALAGPILSRMVQRWMNDINKSAEATRTLVGPRWCFVLIKRISSN